MNQLKTFLQSITTISDEEFENAKSYFKEVHLEKGESLLQEGSVCKQMTFVTKGILRTFYLNHKAQEITHCFRTAGMFASAYRSFILQEPSFLSITALEDVELIVIDHNHLQKLYQTSLVWQRIGRILAERAYIEMEDYASVLNNEFAIDKYQRLLKEQPGVIEKSNLEHIATYLGVTRRTLSRIRQEISVCR